MTRVIKFSKICTFIGCYYAKYWMFDLKKYRGVIFQDTEEWCEIWRQTDWRFEKWHEEYDKFSPEHLKVSKLGLWWDLLIQSRNSVRLKFTEELCFTAMKNDTKFEAELTCRFKIDMNFTNFDPSFNGLLVTKVLMGSSWPKYIMFELKQYRVVIFHGTEEWHKIWKKTDLWFEKWQFSREHLKASNLGLLSRVENVWA